MSGLRREKKKIVFFFRIFNIVQWCTANETYRNFKSIDFNNKIAITIISA